MVLELFLDYFRKSELFNIAPLTHLAVVTPRQAIERAERKNDRYCPTLARRARSRAGQKLPERPPEARSRTMCVSPSQTEFIERRKSSSPTCDVPCHSRTHKKRASPRDDSRDCMKMRASYFCILQCEQNLKSIPYE